MGVFESHAVSQEEVEIIMVSFAKNAHMIKLLREHQPQLRQINIPLFNWSFDEGVGNQFGYYTISARAADAMLEALGRK